MKPKVSGRLEPVRESAIRRFIELASKTSDVVHFEHGEPSFSTPRHIVDAAFEATRDGRTHYGPTPGLPELRTAISRKLSEENKLPIDGPEDVLVVAGTQEAMSLAGLAFLQAGDEALVFDPYYPAYYEETQLAGAKPVIVPLNEQSGYRIEGRNLAEQPNQSYRPRFLEERFGGSGLCG
jgi:aspartate aminotransferase